MIHKTGDIDISVRFNNTSFTYSIFSEMYDIEIESRKVKKGLIEFYKRLKEKKEYYDTLSLCDLKGRNCYLKYNFDHLTFI